MKEPQGLTEQERQTYQWQMWVDDFGEAGQQRLKSASVMISRVGGVGSVVAYELAAAGVGKMVLAHAGNVKPSDLNRQLLMTHDWIGKPRIESIRRRLLDLNPRLELVTVGENVSEVNAAGLASQADLIVDCAPLFPERFAMNRQAVEQGIPLVECAMYELEAQITTIVPGQTGCLACLYPEAPPSWTRQFPVFGAVSGTVACMAAMEAIKVIAGIGETLQNRLLKMDLRDMRFHSLKFSPRADCGVCGSINS
ncbi:HesA/MoeB/ThiF family protein [Roseiconus lacunae]|uniref:HesA/MoeB/ThiF family protein n=1 Tax=Roseiconus lacunae TaxID=2605694 RepID=A0ABT7PC48_9BACT|nr:HesA/MoeB/ThiF family protein [Roseiconus lacunae]MCD0463475.1 HesA/MoeB/ThiF family protein [Roseiconus lacunae]MDM4014075.1 HesA/MoeB/ThiF family protein [Roseiconus lacunae]WRQ53367.1 HesA/MoeB/ThiF family protein [Stieleria sp. HD01]